MHLLRSDVGRHGDHAPCAQRHHGEHQIVVAAVYGDAVTQQFKQAHDLARVGCRLLEAAQQRVPRQLQHHLRRQVQSCAPGHIVDDDGKLYAVCNGVVVFDQPRMAGLVVVGRDHQQAVRAQALGFNGLCNGGAGGVAARAHVERHTARTARHRAFNDRAALGGGDGGRLAGGSQHDQRVRSGVDLPVDQRFQAIAVHPLRAKGRDKRGAAAVKQISLHAIPPEGSFRLSLLRDQGNKNRLWSINRT